MVLHCFAFKISVPYQNLCAQFLHFVLSISVFHYESVLLYTGTSNTWRKGLLLEEGCWIHSTTGCIPWGS